MTDPEPPAAARTWRLWGVSADRDDPDNARACFITPEGRTCHVPGADLVKAAIAAGLLPVSEGERRRRAAMRRVIELARQGGEDSGDPAFRDIEDAARGALVDEEYMSAVPTPFWAAREPTSKVCKVLARVPEMLAHLRALHLGLIEGSTPPEAYRELTELLAEIGDEVLP